MATRQDVEKAHKAYHEATVAVEKTRQAVLSAETAAARAKGTPKAEAANIALKSARERVISANSLRGERLRHWQSVAHSYRNQISSELAWADGELEQARRTT